MCKIILDKIEYTIYYNGMQLLPRMITTFARFVRSRSKLYSSHIIALDCTVLLFIVCIFLNEK